MIITITSPGCYYYYAKKLHEPRFTCYYQSRSDGEFFYEEEVTRRAVADRLKAARLQQYTVRKYQVKTPRGVHRNRPACADETGQKGQKMRKVINYLKKLFNVQLTPEEIVHVTLVQIRAM